jgi:hypothetical protein
MKAHGPPRPHDYRDPRARSFALDADPRISAEWRGEGGEFVDRKNAALPGVKPGPESDSAPEVCLGALGEHVM